MKKYEFTTVEMKYVLEDPELYIIPECLGICKILWDKGIDTVQCSNYAETETTYWVEIDSTTLSDENREYVFKMLDSKKPHFGEDIRFHHPVIVAERNELGIKTLEEIANSFAAQDTKRYTTNDQILDGYKRQGGSLYVEADGTICRNYNPKLINATLEEALKDIDRTFYVEEEGRLYHDKRALDVHKKYLELLSDKRTSFVNVLKLIKNKKE